MLKKRKMTKGFGIMMAVIILLAVMGIAFDSEDIDEVCGVNQSFLYRLNDAWGCVNINNVTVNNITTRQITAGNHTGNDYVTINGRGRVNFWGAGKILISLDDPAFCYDGSESLCMWFSSTNFGAYTFTNQSGEEIHIFNALGLGGYTSLGTITGKHINTAGNITGNKIYGFMWIHNESNADTTIAGANTYVNITETLKNGEGNGITFQNNRELKVTLAGKYSIQYELGFSQAGGAGDEWHIAVGVNGIAQTKCHKPRKISTITDFGSAGTKCVLTLSAGDLITAMIENDNDADDANIMDMQLTMERIGT